MFQRARYSPLIGSAFFKRSGGCAYIRLGEACLAGSRLEHPDRIDCETCCTPVFCDVVWESQQRRLPYGARLGMRRVDFEKVVRNENNKTNSVHLMNIRLPSECANEISIERSDLN